MSVRTTTDRQERTGSVRAIGPVAVTVHTPESAVAAMLDAIEKGAPAIFAFCNAHSVNLARRDAAFVAALARMTVFNDGIGVELGSLMVHGEGFPANLNGTDLTPMLLAGLRRPTRVFLLGSPPGVAERAAAVIAARYPLAEIVGTQHGFLDATAYPALADRIRASGAELVLAGMGQPRQELWAAAWAEAAGAVVCCIGAFLDFTAGVVPRAPGWARRAKLEWAYRLSLEPQRLARRYILGNPSFLLAMTRIAAKRRLARVSNRERRK